MKSRQLLKWLPGFTLIISMLACNLPAQTQATPDLNATVDAGVQIAQLAQTAIAATLNAGVPIIPTDTVTVQPLETFTPTLTPTITFTPTPEGVFMTLSKDTNCRKGPLAVFPAVTTLKSGTTVEVVGRNPQNDTFYVKNPNSPGAFCWLWGQFATLTGNQSGLPVFTPQPTPTATLTPTPTANFSVSYSSLETCGANYGFKLFVKNTGSLTWQSLRIFGSDTTTAFAIDHTSNIFKEYTGCTTILTQEDLTPGEQSFVLPVSPGHLPYDPSGDAISLTIKLCSGQDLTGTCLSKSLNFTP